MNDERFKIIREKLRADHAAKGRPDPHPYPTIEAFISTKPWKKLAGEIAAVAGISTTEAQEYLLRASREFHERARRMRAEISRRLQKPPRNG